MLLESRAAAITRAIRIVQLGIVLVPLQRTKQAQLRPASVARLLSVCALVPCAQTDASFAKAAIAQSSCELRQFCCEV